MSGCWWTKIICQLGIAKWVFQTATMVIIVFANCKLQIIVNELKFVNASTKRCVCCDRRRSMIKLGRANGRCKGMCRGRRTLSEWIPYFGIWRRGCTQKSQIECVNWKIKMQIACLSDSGGQPWWTKENRLKRSTDSMAPMIVSLRKATGHSVTELQLH